MGANFQNQLVDDSTEGDDYAEYYRPFFSLEPLWLEIEEDTFSVRNIMQIAMIAWLDLIWQNNNRFMWPEFMQLNTFQANLENLMLDETQSRIIPIDNGAMLRYVDGLDPNALYPPAPIKATNLLAKIKNKLALKRLADEFVALNSGNDAGAQSLYLFPKSLEDLIAKIVLLTWTHYGAKIAENIYALFDEKSEHFWKDRTKAKIFDGTNMGAKKSGKIKNYLAQKSADLNILKRKKQKQKDEGEDTGFFETYLEELLVGMKDMKLLHMSVSNQLDINKHGAMKIKYWAEENEKTDEAVKEYLNLLDLEVHALQFNRRVNRLRKRYYNNN